ncbi:MAG: PHP domain-containing protein [Lachnospiraceae bacterium]|nr:PHP domain-containing protein [Lachnospiraceae bacterium]
MKADLHCHTTNSDGSTPLEQLIPYAKRIGLDALAITDHDTMQGIPLALELGQKYNLTIIPGVECTAKDPTTGRSVHILCYKPKNPEPLLPILEQTSKNRAAAKTAIVNNLSRQYPITMEDVQVFSKNSASIFESHLMQALANLGYTNQPIGPFMDKSIGKKSGNYVPVIYPEVAEVIDAMTKAGGIISIAHPGQFDSMDLVRRLVDTKSIQALECFHPRNSEEITKECLEIAAAHDLIITGGTDFHGMYSKNPHPLGSFTTDGANLERILAF